MSNTNQNKNPTLAPQQPKQNACAVPQELNQHKQTTNNVSLRGAVTDSAPPPPFISSPVCPLPHHISHKKTRGPSLPPPPPFPPVSVHKSSTRRSAAVSETFLLSYNTGKKNTKAITLHSLLLRSSSGPPPTLTSPQMSNMSALSVAMAKSSPLSPPAGENSASNEIGLIPRKLRRAPPAKKKKRLMNRSRRAGR